MSMSNSSATGGFPDYWKTLDTRPRRMRKMMNALNDSYLNRDDKGSFGNETLITVISLRRRNTQCRPTKFDPRIREKLMKLFVDRPQCKPKLIGFVPR